MERPINARVRYLTKCRCSGCVKAFLIPTRRAYLAFRCPRCQHIMDILSVEVRTYSNEILMILFNIQRPLFNIQCTILSKMEWIKCVWSYYGKITENIVFPSAKRRVKIFNHIWNIFPVDLSSIIICSFILFLCTKFIYYYVWFKFKQS